VRLLFIVDIGFLCVSGVARRALLCLQSLKNHLRHNSYKLFCLLRLMEETWEEDEEDDEEYVEQVFRATCPHCKQPINVVLEPAVAEEEDEEL